MASRGGLPSTAASRRTATTCRLLAIGVASLQLAGCVSITAQPRAVLERDDGSFEIHSLACGHAVSVATSAAAEPARSGLDPGAIRIVTWNIHKQQDAGWQRDLREFITHRDIVLLQESVLEPPLQELITAAGLRFVMASSFLHGAVDIGVLTASRTTPLANCTQRVVEPVLRLPKSAVISWFPIRGMSAALAVVNVHAINFSISLGAYRAQFEEIADALASHRGPIILAGDLNTWTAARAAIVKRTAERLGLVEVAFDDDRRRVFFGRELDHVYTRGLEPIGSSAVPVTSSDHNPVTATLRVSPP